MLFRSTCESGTGSKVDLNTLKLVKEGKKDKEAHGRCQFQCHWGTFFEQFLTVFELRELAWVTFDRASLQRGYQVFNEVCSSCHSIKYLSYRNLTEKGGPEFSEEEAKAIAVNFEVTDGPDI